MNNIKINLGFELSKDLHYLLIPTSFQNVRRWIYSKFKIYYYSDKRNLLINIKIQLC